VWFLGLGNEFLTEKLILLRFDGFTIESRKKSSPNRRMDEKLTALKTVIQKMNPAKLQENIYECLEHLCSFLLAYRQGKGAKGWVGNFVGESGQPVFSVEEQAMIEKTLEGGGKWLDALFEEEPVVAQPQKGGAALPKLMPGGSIISRLPSAPITGDDVSMDKAFHRVLGAIDSVDTYWNRFSRESPGIYKFFMEKSVGTPEIKKYGIPSFTLPLTAILTFLTTALEIVRVMYSTGPLENPQIRYITTAVLLIDDMIQGNWRQMILTSMGFINPTGVYAGAIGRLFVGAWLLINPELRSRLSLDVYKSTKSLFIGFLVWAFSIFAPSTLKTKLDKEVFEPIREKTAGIEEKLKAFQESSNKKLIPTGYQMHVDLKFISALSKISVEDLQNIQSLIHWKQFVCSKEIQDVLEPLYNSPVTRIIVELLGIPTYEEDIDDHCGTLYKQPLDDNIQGMIKKVETPGGPPEPAQKGGSKKSRTLTKFQQWVRKRLTQTK
jgi:hypothetical protein